MSSQTLSQYLRRDNPSITNRYCIRGSNTKSRGNNWIEPQEIALWEDFNVDSLTAIYNGDLNEVLQCVLPDLHDHRPMPQYPFCEIRDEDSLNSLLIKWNHSTVTDALAAAQKYRQDPQQIYMVKGSQADYPGSLSNFRPDWAGIVLPTSVTKPPTILPGDTKLKIKWSSSWIKQGPINPGYKEKDWKNPLSQIFTYCTWANTRYGYIITDAELVVVRVRPGSETDLQSVIDAPNNLRPNDGSPASQAQRFGILEYKAVPWDNGGEGPQDGSAKMTVNLALWWLHMMAAKSNGIENRYLSLRDLARDTVDNKDTPRYPPTPESLNTTPASRPHGKRLPMRRNETSSLKPQGKNLSEQPKRSKRARDDEDHKDYRLRKSNKRSNF